MPILTVSKGIYGRPTEQCVTSSFLPQFACLSLCIVQEILLAFRQIVIRFNNIEVDYEIW